MHTQKLLHSFVTAGEPTHPVMTRNMFVFIHADIYNQEVMLKNIYIFKSKKVGSPIKHYPTYPSIYGRFLLMRSNYFRMVLAVMIHPDFKTSRLHHSEPLCPHLFNLVKCKTKNIIHSQYFLTPVYTDFQFCLTRTI